MQPRPIALFSCVLQLNLVLLCFGKSRRVFLGLSVSSKYKFREHNIDLFSIFRILVTVVFIYAHFVEGVVVVAIVFLDT